jgi:hypothetical protein
MYGHTISTRVWVHYSTGGVTTYPLSWSLLVTTDIQCRWESARVRGNQRSRGTPRPLGLVFSSYIY